MTLKSQLLYWKAYFKRVKSTEHWSLVSVMPFRSLVRRLHMLHCLWAPMVLYPELHTAFDLSFIKYFIGKSEMNHLLYYVQCYGIVRAIFNRLLHMAYIIMVIALRSNKADARLFFISFMFKRTANSFYKLDFYFRLL